MIKRTTCLAFTLVELSIVLVILGLLVGGVIAGQSLIKAAEFRKQISDLQAIQAAHMTFKDKYFCIPGDCTETSRFFPVIAPANNGNGDGMIQCWYGAPYIDECNVYFYSLNLAGLLNLQPRSGTNYLVAYYKGVIKNTAMFVNYMDRYGQQAITGRSRAFIHLHKINNPWANGGIFTPEEAWQLDSKYDDGVPTKGAIFGFWGADDAGVAQTCATGDAYNLTQTTIGCRMDFKVE
jgi:prepilin-type N-terminal cleavage/methylation domain-containing protein